MEQLEVLPNYTGRMYKCINKIYFDKNSNDDILDFTPGKLYYEAKEAYGGDIVVSEDETRFTLLYDDTGYIMLIKTEDFKLINNKFLIETVN